MTSHPFWKHSHLKYSFLPITESKVSEESTGVVCIYGLIRACASLMEDISAAYFLVDI